MDTLWLMEIALDKTWGQLIPIYAKDEEDATQKARALAEERGLPLVRVTPFPNGFLIRHETIPGTQQDTPDA